MHKKDFLTSEFYMAAYRTGHLVLEGILSDVTVLSTGMGNAYINGVSNTINGMLSGTGNLYINPTNGKFGKTS